MHPLPTPFCPARLWKQRCSLNGGMPNNLFPRFSLVSFCAEPIWPLSCTRCAFPWSRSSSTLPFIFTPLPPAMNDSLGEAPFLHQKAVATIHHSPASISLISPCCVTLETPLRSRTCFIFFIFFIHAPSLALSLSCIQYWLFMLFNVVERARGLRTGEKRSSWHTYAPVVNSSSQHSSKYTDLLLFPLPPFSLSLSFPDSSYNWELLWTSAPHVALLQRSPYGRLRCSNAQAKYLHTNHPAPLPGCIKVEAVEMSDLGGGLEGSGECSSHLWAEKASVKPDREQKWSLHLEALHVSFICQPTFRSSFDSYSPSYTNFCRSIRRTLSWLALIRTENA